MVSDKKQSEQNIFIQIKMPSKKCLSERCRRTVVQSTKDYTPSEDCLLINLDHSVQGLKPSLSCITTPSSLDHSVLNLFKPTGSIMCFIWPVSIPVSILYKSTVDRYRPVRVADGPITARCRFIKNASWVSCLITSVYLSIFNDIYF